MFRGNVGDLIQDTCWGGNRLLLTKEFNLGIIDSGRQICPWPMDLIFRAPYSYLEPSHAGFRLQLHCLRQLDLTAGNRHDGKGLLSQKFLCTGSFPWQAGFFSPSWSCMLTWNWRATHPCYNVPAASWSSHLKCTWIEKPDEPTKFYATNGKNSYLR